MRSGDLVRFIREREKARLNKEQGKKYKLDPIIAKYRFCNVRRNDDRVTKFVFDWARQYSGSPHLWFALVVARLFNNEDTLEEIGGVLPFQPRALRDILHTRRDKGLKNFNAAYIVSTNGRAMDKVDYLIEEVLTPLWEKRSAITASFKGATLAQMHELLTAQNGLGSFMAAQVLADLKYMEPAREDFFTFAASGPGSKRGMNRVLNRPIGQPMREHHFREYLEQLRTAVNKKFPGEAFTAQDIQNCLCEFDKYERARLGEGEPKQLYKPRS